MKNKVIIIMILLGLMIASPFQVYARASSGSGMQETSGVIAVGPGQASVAFAELGFRETTLVSPFDATRVLFSIPPNWRLSAGGAIQLDYEVNLSGADAGLVGTDQNPYGGSLLVTFNDQLIGTISLKELGSKSVQLQLPPNALTSVRQDGRHQLTISLDAQFSCLYNIRAIVTIKPTSTFTLPFEVSAPELNLSRLPAPFHLRNALLPDRTLVVVPNEPDAKELTAALNLMSGFGSIVGETFDFSLITPAELTKDDLANSNLIFVGRPEQFDLLSDVKFPVAVQDKQFVSLPPESASDGVVEMALSPWNESKVVLLAGGSSVDAVVKAAQAVSSGKILIYQNPALAYVADVQPLSDAIPVVEDFSLQSLGYQSQTLSGIGLSSVQYSFNASKEQLNAKDATIDLVYYHSGLLDYGYSSFTVELNNQVISSTAFSKETEQLTTMQLKIPQGVLRFGENRLNISARMLTTTSCDATGFSNPWLTISDQTRFHLPASLGISSDAPASLLDLKSYPDLFTTYSDLGDVAFVLPKSNSSTWKIAGQLAYDLGSTANPLISNLQAVYAEDVPQQVLGESSLILIGKPSAMPPLQRFNEQLPAPFDFANDTASESNMQVVYRIPSGMSVGYLELLSSPYNAEKPVLVLAGNSDDGVTLAGSALLQNELSSQLTGVFAVTNGTQIATGSASSPFSAVGTLVPADAGVVTTPVPASSSAPAPLPRPGWLLPLLVISGIAILLIIMWVIVSALPRKRAAPGESFVPTSKGEPRTDPGDSNES
ncbi:MAG TPA: cellulose biosynthesis cyclic di-GMP-binding regulatory protein BcsB [Anaerolineales bacterium]|nr:cellulose biosynthesis cyclic di-GMP-binding regulatory protein BcsB [Anaerolineales bacterium]